MDNSDLPYLDYIYHNSTIAERYRCYHVEDAGDERTIVEMTLPPPITRCADGRWLVSETGELLDGNPTRKSKQERKCTIGEARSVQNLRRTMRRMQSLLCTNYRGEKWTWFVTLTFAEKVYDLEKTHRPLSNFWRRFKRLSEQNAGARYLCVPEPHHDGAWHLHLIVFFEVEMPEPQPQEIRACWKLGSVGARCADDAYGLGCYLNPLTARTEKTGGEAGSKRDRLGFYPPNKQLIWHSKGMKEPTVRRYAKEDCELDDLLEGYRLRAQYPLLSPDGHVVGTCTTATRQTFNKIIEKGCERRGHVGARKC